MKKIELRNYRISDAARLVEMLNHPDFVTFPAKPKSVEEEREWLRRSREKRRAGSEVNLGITYGGKLVGGIGAVIDRKRAHVCEIGYFVDRDHWGRGIATRALRLMEDFVTGKLGVTRIEVLTLKANKASQRVALKCGFRKEGVQRGKLLLNGQPRDAYIFAKSIA